MVYKVVRVLALSMLIVNFAFAQKIKFPLENAIDSASYALGLNIASQLKSQGMSSINEQKVADAIRDIYNGADPLIMPNEAGVFFNNYIQQQKNKMSAENLKKSNEFLEENKTKKGVVTLPSGLQYKVLKEGSGPVPQKNDKVSAHYTGKLVNGTIFDSSVQRGQPFSVNVGQGRVIKGWDEALLLMKQGSKWELYIPPDLGYGANPRPGSGIEPNDVLIFELELLTVETN